MRFLNWVASNRWAMEPNAADFYCTVLESIIERRLADVPLDRELIESQSGKTLENTYSMTIRDGVATMDIDGPIFKRAGMFGRMSGAVSTEMMALDFNRALDDSKVKSIIFNINSPGGEAAGTNEFADMVFAARGRKPIVAYVDGMAASAAYWIASACDEIVTDELGDLGSIGTVCTIRDTTKRDAMNGIKVHEYTSVQSPFKRPKPGTKEGDALFTTWVNDATDVFGAKVARNRGVSVETVYNDFGGGWLKTGQKAVEAGLADRVGSYESLHAELSNGVWEAPKRPEPADDAAKESQMATENDAAPVEETAGKEQSAPATESPEMVALRQQLADAESRAAANETAAKEAKERAAELDASNFAAKHAAKILPAGREAFSKAAAELHPLAAEAGFADKLAALCDAIPDSVTPLTQGTLTQQQLDGAAPSQSGEQKTEEQLAYEASAQYAETSGPVKKN